jgi:arginase
MTLNLSTIHLIGSASGVAAADAGCWEGPLVLEKSPYLKTEMAKHGFHYQWDAMLQPDREAGAESPLAVVTEHCVALADTVSQLVREKAFFTVFGGDHSCAIGTWSGVYSEVSQQGDFGLIWVDAHMDSHTPETSETGNIHGMPLACLLGYGNPKLTQIHGHAPKLKAEHVCVIGARSFEAGEEELLKDLNIRIYFMDEVLRRGLKEIMAEAISIVSKGTVGYGVTIDIDSIDPTEAPGTGVSEPGGLSAKELCNALTQVTGDKRLIGAEIVEFDPHRDKNALTEKLSVQLLLSILSGKLI